MRTRRLVWIFSILLSLGAIQATHAASTSPFADVRVVSCRVLEERSSKPAASKSVRTPRPATSAPRTPPPSGITSPNAWLSSLHRFQRPPPPSAV